VLLRQSPENIHRRMGRAGSFPLTPMNAHARVARIERNFGRGLWNFIRLGFCGRTLGVTNPAPVFVVM
jgi:hypothetical protein